MAYASVAAAASRVIKERELYNKIPLATIDPGDKKGS